METKSWTIDRFEGAEQLADSVARRLIGGLGQSQVQSIALSGGRITVKLFQAVSDRAKDQNLPLGDLKFFWADERCVPLDSPDSNYALAKEHLFDPLKIAEEQVFPFAGGQSPSEMSKLGQSMLSRELPHEQSGVPVIDLILLGMGEDGHIASLFPENLSLDQGREESCYDVVASKPPPDRITLSFPVLAAAKEVWLVISGDGKAEVLREALGGDKSKPVGHLLSLRQHTSIFTDLVD